MSQAATAASPAAEDGREATPPGSPIKLVGLYKTPEAASKAVALMGARGIPDERTSLLRPDDRAGPHLATYASNLAARYACLGAAVAGAAVALLLAALTVGEIELEGIAQIGSGALVPALAGFGFGAPLGALVGALYGWRQPVLRADFFDADDRRGGTALGVLTETPDELEAARFAFRSTGALQIRRQPG